MLKFVYIVDDDETVRAALQCLLSVHSEFMTGTYRSGTEFLADAETIEAGVVLLDIDMPGASGLDVLATIKARAHKMAVIMITGRGDTRMAVQAMKLGAFDFLEKPFEHGMLLETIARCFERLEAAGASAARVSNAQQCIGRLTARERDILMGLVSGHTNKSSAAELGLSVRTVEIHRGNVMKKLGARSVSDVFRLAHLAGLIEP